MPCLEYCMLCSLQLNRYKRTEKIERWRGRYKGIELFPYEEQLNRLGLEAWRRGDRAEYKNRIMNSMEEEAESTKVKENQMKPAGYRF